MVTRRSHCGISRIYILPFKDSFAGFNTSPSSHKSRLISVSIGIDVILEIINIFSMFLEFFDAFISEFMLLVA